MSDTVLSAYGLSDLVLILIVGGMVLLIVVVAFFLSSSGSFGKFLNGIDKTMHEKLVYDNIPKLREIAKLCPDEKISTGAQKVLQKWDDEIEPSLKHMSSDRRKKVLRSLYRGNMDPVLQKYKQIYES
jgi:hypothetical protein